MKMRFPFVGIALLLPLLAQAGPVLYGNVNLSINKIDEAHGGEYRMDSHTSSIGVKGSEDLESGLKLIYKVEFGYDTTDQNLARDIDGDGSIEEGVSSITDRDQWIGLANKDYGVLRLGTVSTSYKSSGASIDPLYRTALEGRGFLATQSVLHDGEGVNGGRSTNTIRYDSPEKNGLKIVATYSLGEQRKNTYGAGAHYDQMGVKLHLDYLNSESADAAAIKLGGQYEFGNGFIVGGQYEHGDAELFRRSLDGVSAEIDSVFMAHATYIKGNTAYVVTAGRSAGYSKSYAVAFDHKLSSDTDIYAGVGFSSLELEGKQYDSAYVVGLRHKF